MWEASLIRGPEGHNLTTVKGHATTKDIQEGKANEVDKEGNDNADECATKGIGTISAKEAIRWIAQRHEAYCKFMGRIQQMIVHVLKAEKTDRKKRREVERYVKGYDQDKWIKGDGRIKGSQVFQGRSDRLEINTPTKGNHTSSNTK